MTQNKSLEAVSWNPWHGCKRCSPGCEHCFVFAMDRRFGRDTSVINKVSSNFNLPIKKNRQGTYKYPSGTHFKLCFTSDFFIEEADAWRTDCWNMIRERSDCTFILTTKRADRIYKCLPRDWGKGWDNVTIAVSCENQQMADKRIPYLMLIPMKHRYIFVSPVLEYVNLRDYLNHGGIERVCVGGESYSGARECNFDWVEQIYIDCLRTNTEFNFHQTGSNFKVKDKVFGGTLSKQQQQAQLGEQELRKKYKNKDIAAIEDIIKGE